MDSVDKTLWYLKHLLPVATSEVLYDEVWSQNCAQAMDVPKEILVILGPTVEMRWSESRGQTHRKIQILHIPSIEIRKPDVS